MKDTLKYSSIRPGEIWLDTNGERIQAHAGSILVEDDGTFVWYGENKERTMPGSGIWHWGVRAYSSRDLYNWEDRGLIIPPNQDDPTSPLHPARMMDRPHIIRNPRTGKYVCWIKVMESDAYIQRATVLVAASLFGPYEIVHREFFPLGISAGDLDLVVDPDDGKGYYFFEKPHSELICADLSDDFTDVTGHFTRHFPHPSPPWVREAPAYFRRGEVHYLVTSGTSGYFPNPSEFASATDYHGPWTVLGNAHPTDTSGTSFASQIGSVFKHPGKRDLYIALGDRWLTDLGDDAGATFKRMSAVAKHDTDEAIAATTEGRDGVPPEERTFQADYVWLPIIFDGDMPTVEWHDEWRIEDYD
jgi:hypothetical protein